jgi:hypothetical protein
LGADDDDIPHPQLFPLQPCLFRHDLFEKPVSALSGMPGASRMRGTPSDKGCGLPTQARRHFISPQEGPSTH